MSSQVQQTLLFAKTFLKHPFMLGSFIPSSRYLTENLLQRLDWQRARVIVEYGPGVGTLTWPMLQRMHKDAQLIVIETNQDFVRYLRAWKHPQLRVIQGSAEGVRQALAGNGVRCADHIVSGIPFSTLPVETRQRILRESYDVLCETGTFLVYQFSGAVLPHLREVFTGVRQDFEVRNILPARIFHCVR